MDDKRSIILATALKLFVENGFHATPTAMIVKEAGVATGTLFHHFSTKEELINTLYLETKDKLISAISEGLEEQVSVKGKLRRLWENMMQWSFDNVVELMFFRQYSASPYIDRLTIEQGYQRFAFLFDLMNRGKGEEVLKDMPSELLLEIANGIMFGTASYFLNNRDKWEGGLKEKSFQAFWDCLKG